MRVAGKENERMLQDQGSDPHIIRRDGSALLSQLPVNGGIMVRCLFIGVEHAYAGLEQKSPQDGFIPRPLTTYGKARAQFS